MLDELETQHKQILLRGLYGKFYLKEVLRSNQTEKIKLLFEEFGAAKRFRVYLQYRTGSNAFAFYFKDNRLKRCLDCKGPFF